MADPIVIPRKSEAADCINTGTVIGNSKTNPEHHGRSYAIVPEGAKVEYLERPDYPPRRSGTVKLSDTASFLDYWDRQSDESSYIYGSMKPAQFIAVFNEHDKAMAPYGNWRDHRALYTLEHSDEWMVWTKRNAQPFDGNEAFAYWLEENLFDIKDPEPATFMDIALSIRVRQGQVFGKKVNLNDGNIILDYANNVEGTAGGPTGDRVSIPEKFEISIPVFKGLESPKYTVEARFRYRLHGGNLTLRYDLVRPHKVIEKAFTDMLTEIQGKTAVDVLFGTPE